MRRSLWLNQWTWIWIHYLLSVKRFPLSVNEPSCHRKQQQLTGRSMSNICLLNYKNAGKIIKPILFYHAIKWFIAYRDRPVWNGSNWRVWVFVAQPAPHRATDITGNKVTDTKRRNMHKELGEIVCEAKERRWWTAQTTHSVSIIRPSEQGEHGPIDATPEQLKHVSTPRQIRPRSKPCNVICPSSHMLKKLLNMSWASFF